MRLTMLICAGLLALAQPAAAEVVAAQADGFQVRETATVAASPGLVYAGLGRIGAWWSPRHTFSGQSRNLRLELRAGGCMCERLPGGGSVLHQTVINADPGKVLRLSGGLGPMQALAVAAVTEWRITPESGGSKVVLTMTVGGYAPGGLTPLAPAVDAVMGEQLARLKAYLETGDPTGGRRTPG